MESEKIQSPCVRNCCLDNDDICLGCFRSLQEITQWSQSDDIARQKIINKIMQRKRRKQALS